MLILFWLLLHCILKLIVYHLFNNKIRRHLKFIFYTVQNELIDATELLVSHVSVTYVDSIFVIT